MGLAALSTPARLPASSFDEFAASRPEGETWEQIDGLFVMQATPTMPHTIIASNIERLLNDALAEFRPDLFARREVTIVTEKAGIVGGGNHVPDVAVLDDADLKEEVSKTAICHLAVEVVGPSDRRPVLETGRPKIEIKVELYQNLPSCNAVMKVEQSRLQVMLLIRTAQGWSRSEHEFPDDRLDLPGFGLQRSASAIYARTPALRGTPARRDKL